MECLLILWCEPPGLNMLCSQIRRGINAIWRRILIRALASTDGWDCIVKTSPWRAEPFATSSLSARFAHPPQIAETGATPKTLRHANSYWCDPTMIHKSSYGGRGRFIRLDLRERSKSVCWTGLVDLFPYEEPLDKQLKINGRPSACRS